MQTWTLRRPKAGDIGWVIKRHGALYAAAGFRLVASAPHSDFGPSMVGEDWELDL